MRQLPLCVLVAGILACGGEGPAPSNPGSPGLDGGTSLSTAPGPEILSLEIVPESPTRNDVIGAELRVQNAGRVAVEVQYTWYHNAQLVQQGVEARLQALELRRGDEIRVTADVWDGASRVSFRSSPVEIQNTPPQLSRLALDPLPPTAGSELRAVPYAHDPDGDAIEFQYRWFRNGRELENASEAILPAGRLRRGDRVRVSALATDTVAESGWTDSADATLANSAPAIRSTPAYAPVASNRYEYQVIAVDPDGDRPLRYQLVEGPTGMQLGAYSGLVRWEIPRSTSGEIPVEVAVIDPQGAEVHQRFALRIGWDTPPANRQ